MPVLMEDGKIKCLFLTCPKPATQIIQGPSSHRPWHGCGKHAPGMAKALSIGSTGDFSASTRKLKQ